MTINNGDRKELFNPDTLSFTALYITIGIAEQYILAGAVINRFKLSHNTFIKNNGNTKDQVVLDDTYINTLHYRIDEDENVPVVSLQLVDLNLKVRYQVGDMIVKDVLCNL